MTSRTADLILRNAYLVDPAQAESRHPGAIALKNGLIAAMGDEAQILDLQGNQTEIIDLRGAFVTPGLIDGHAHPVLGNDVHVGVDLSAARDLASLRVLLAAEAERLAPGAWMRGYSLDPIAIAGTPDIAAAIEDAVGGRPVFLMMFDCHGAVVSRAALAQAGIAGPRDFAGASLIVCNKAGQPTGLLLEAEAMDLVRNIIPPRGFTERLDSLRARLKQMAAVGLTGMHVMDANGDSLACLEALEEMDGLPLRFHVYPWINPGATQADLDDLLAMQGRAGKYWRIQGAKFFMDGTIDGGTGWLHEVDTLGEGTQALWPDSAAYSEAARFFAMRGVQTVTHAIGDAAVRHVLDTLAQVPEDLRRRARHRIEHIETLPDEDVGRFFAEGIIPSMQPSHAVRYSKADQSDNWSQRLGPERTARGWRCADILATGAPLVLGSDWPVAPYDSREVLACARTRKLAGMDVRDAVQPHQALTAAQALTGLTRHAAYAVGEEAIAGGLAPGMRADLTVFTIDPLRAPADELESAPFALTVMGGRITHNGLN